MSTTRSYKVLSRGVVVYKTHHRSEAVYVASFTKSPKIIVTVRGN